MNRKVLTRALITFGFCAIVVGTVLALSGNVIAYAISMNVSAVSFLAALVVKK